MSQSHSIFSKILKPWYQAAIAFGLYIFILFCLFIYSALFKTQFPKQEVWLYSTAMMFFFILMNVIYGLTTKERVIYYRDTIFALAVYLVVTALIGRYISGQDIRAVKTYSWMTMVFVMVFVLFSTLINLMRKIMELVMNQENKIRNEK